MTEHHVGVKVHLYPEEFHVILKLMNRVIDHEDFMNTLTDDELTVLDDFLDYFMEVRPQ